MSTPPLALIAAVTACCLIPCAAGAWPISADAPLEVGPVRGAFGPRGSVVTDDAGAIWTAWQDDFCFGDLRVQRVGPLGSVWADGGIAVAEDPSCGNTFPPILSALANGAVTGLQQGPPEMHPLVAVDAVGGFPWGPGVIADSDAIFERAVRLNDGQTLVVSRASSELRLQKLNALSEPVWPTATVLNTNANLRVLGVFPGPDGSMYLAWDTPLPYTRMVWVHRILADGSPAWDTAVQAVQPPPGFASSKHSRPALVQDGAGGLALFYTRGFEQASQPTSLHLQRIAPDGTWVFAAPGPLVSTSTTDRQFHPNAALDPATNSLLVTWMSGLVADEELRVQSMALDGSRQWGPEGIFVTDVGPPPKSSAAYWQSERLHVALADPSGVVVHRFTSTGASANGPGEAGIVAVGANFGGDGVNLTASGDGVAVVWQEDGPTLDDRVVAQRVTPVGTLGGPACDGGAACHHPAAAVPFGPPGDVDDSGAADVLDVQCQILATLAALAEAGPPSCLPEGAESWAADLDCSGVPTVSDTVAAIGWVLSGLAETDPLAVCPPACGICLDP